MSYDIVSYECGGSLKHESMPIFCRSAALLAKTTIFSEDRGNCEILVASSVAHREEYVFGDLRTITSSRLPKRLVGKSPATESSGLIPSEIHFLPVP